ncbi:hypothetical protein ACX4MT_16815, partial [Roseomonas mucosa]
MRRSTRPWDAAAGTDVPGVAPGAPWVAAGVGACPGAGAAAGGSAAAGWSDWGGGAHAGAVAGAGTACLAT